MFAVAHECLTAAGFVDIGLDHFARPGDALAVAQRAGTLHRNFQGYTTCADALLYGFGLSAISATADTYTRIIGSSRRGGRRWRPAPCRLSADSGCVRRNAATARSSCG